MTKNDWFLRSNLKLRHLQLLIALDELRSIGRVASLMLLTQPAVSKMLSALESGLETPLFKRTPHGMQPTEAGDILIAYARDALRQLSVAQDNLRGLTEGPLRRLVLGVMPSVSSVLVPRFLVGLTQSDNPIAITTRDGVLESLLPLLQNGEVDVIAGILPKYRISADVHIELLYTDRFVIAARKDHPLTRIAALDWPDLRDYPLIMATRSALTYEMFIEMLGRHQISRPRRSLESISTLTNIGVLRRSDFYTLMPSEIAHEYEAMGIISILPIPVPDLHRDVGLLWLNRRNNQTIKTVAALFHKVAQAIQDEQGAVA
jgi:DNA-binding transcriptional LysR family regulator